MGFEGFRSLQDQSGIVKLLKESRLGIHPMISQITQDGEVIFVGSQETLRPDHIIFATGYQRHYSFLPEGYQNVGDQENEVNPSLLVFHPSDRGVTYLTEPVVPQGAWPLFLEQAQAIAAFYQAESQNSPLVTKFDHLRQASPQPHLKGHHYLRANSFHVDPKIYTRALQSFSEWILEHN